MRSHVLYDTRLVERTDSGEGKRGRWGLIAVVTAFALLRLAHAHLLWADEDYHIAAALNIVDGKVPYRDFWYDKPPLAAVYYLLTGAHAGVVLRLLDAIYVVVACALAYKLAREWWSESEGYWAAGLLAFFTTFYLPSAVIPFAADAVMLVPHLAAVLCAHRGRALWAGVWSGVAFLANTKALFVLATCAAWLFPSVAMLGIGFVMPLVLALLVALTSGAWSGYCEQVWRWGLTYAERSPVRNPLRNGLIRTADWLGFHAAVAVAAAYGFNRMVRDDRFRLGVWLLFSFVAVALGSRFAPHYFLQLLPAVVITAARGIVVAQQRFGTRAIAVLAILLAIPLVRFGPRYVSLALDEMEGQNPRWSDVAMDLDSREVAEQIRAMSGTAETLFVWGYRPDIYVYTRLVSDSKFWDSQPLTGVPADRHLSATTPIYSGPAAQNRRELVRSRPTFIVDGLGLLNPRLAPAVYPELRPWLAHYRLAGRTKLSLIYRRAE